MTNTKIFTILGIFVLLVLSLTLTSAFTIDLVSPLDGMTQTSRDVNFQFSFSNVILGENDNYLCDLNIDGLYSSSKSVINETATNITITANNLAIGSHTWDIYCDGSGPSPTDATSETRTFTIQNPTSDYEFCNEGLGSVGDDDLKLEIEINNHGEGEDDEWLPLDRIEIDVEIINNKDVDFDNVMLELGIIEKDSGNNVADDMIWISEDDEEVDIGDIDDDEDEKHTFEFKVDPEAGIDESDYYVVVKAYTDNKEDEFCIDHSSDFNSADNYEEISIDRESEDERLVIVDVEDLEQPLEALCGQDVVLSVDVYNIGDEDQEQTMVNLYNTELGFDIETVLRDDLDQGDRETVEFRFSIPQDAEEKSYTLKFLTSYDYSDSKDIYRETSEEFTTSIKVSGNCGAVVQEPIVNAKLISDAKVGEELIVEVSVTNRGDKTDFIVGVEDSGSWADSLNVDHSISSIDNGETKKITVTLTPTKAGSQSFTISVISNGETKTQPVTVTIEEQTGLFTGAFAGFEGTLGSAGSLLIIGIIALLVLIVVVLIVKLAKRPAPQEF